MTAVMLFALTACGGEKAPSTITLSPNFGSVIGAVVTLKSNDGNKSKTYKQTAKGTAVIFNKVEVGSYTLTVEHKDYFPFTNNEITVHTTVPGYTINVHMRGPAGGYVFYDKGNNSDGWQYLEAAPADTEFNADWSTAIQRCKELNVSGISGWRLPTKEELDLMYRNLKVNGLGDFQETWYWSSSQYDTSAAWIRYFVDGQQDGGYKLYTLRARACRAF